MMKKPAPTPRSRASAPTLTVVADTPAALAPTFESIPTTPTQGMKTMTNIPFDFAAIGKDNLEAFTASSKIWAAGVQELSKEFAASAKASLEESVAAFKALATVKSVKEAIDLQSAYSKTAVEKAMAESKKLTEASLKLTEAAMAPITARMAVAVGTFSKAA